MHEVFYKLFFKCSQYCLCNQCVCKLDHVFAATHCVPTQFTETSNYMTQTTDFIATSLSITKIFVELKYSPSVTAFPSSHRSSLAIVRVKIQFSIVFISCRTEADSLNSQSVSHFAGNSDHILGCSATCAPKVILNAALLQAVYGAKFFMRCSA